MKKEQRANRAKAQRPVPREPKEVLAELMEKLRGKLELKATSGSQGEAGPRGELRHLSRMLCLRDSCRSFEARLKHGIELVKSGSDVSGQGSPLTLLEGRDGEAEFEF